MRVSTSQIYYNGTSNIMDGQSNLYKLQSQLSTGRRVLTPKDDPVAATQSLMVSQAKEVNSNFMANQSTADTQLAFMDTQLGNIGDLLISIYEHGKQATNPTYGPQDKQKIVEQMKRDFESLVNLANTHDADGNYYFAGARSNVQPFTVTGSGGNYGLAATNGSVVSYNGDDGQRQLQVETLETVPTSLSGQDVFMRVLDSSGNLNGRSVFDALQNMIDSIDQGSTVTPTPSITTALNDLNDAVSHVARIRAQVGALQNQVEALTSVGSDLSLQYDLRLSELRDIDYAEVISQFTQQQTQLEASQQSFLKLSQLSLFDIL